MKKRLFLFLLGPAIIIGWACGWDYDTMKMERQAFPDVFELIAGKFIRHSQAFYYWRVKDREHKIESYPDSLELYDDLGVALDKTGEHEKAIQTMLTSDSIQKGRYETYANLGTFYIHNHEFKKGARYIEKAIEINPEAHFGREVYQLHLVRYLIEKTDDKIELPLARVNHQDNFYDYLYQHHIQKNIANGSTQEAEIAKAIKGLAGMMHFGQYRSPILLECLGDLLLEAEGYGGAGHLGARAYLKASFETRNGPAHHYRIKASMALEKNRPGHIAYMEADSSTIQKMIDDARPLYSIGYLEDALKYEIYQAELWFDTLRKKEMQWIQMGVNVDSAFSTTYFTPVEPIRHRSERHIAKNLAISDSAWLAIQLNNPPFENNYLKNQTINTQKKAEIDSLFAVQYPPQKDTSEEQKPNEEKHDQKDEGSGNLLWYFAFGLIIIGAYLVWKDYRRGQNN